MTITIPVTQARSQLLRLVDDVDSKFNRVDLTKKGVIKASLVSSEYLDSLEETIYSLKHSLKDIKQSEKEIEVGEYLTLDELKQAISQ
ncbi:hypothetical protein A2W24_04585 [Microgenomates group bacterium RBG_16_45_19]|nr:MAG: hypothetical protein A2W24_04585 [Microgenomates group bacterium RBG_16_45_19]